MNSIGIGALAQGAGVKIDRVRYDERSGLLTPKSLVFECRRINELERVRGGLASVIVACPRRGRAAGWPDFKARGGKVSP